MMETAVFILELVGPVLVLTVAHKFKIRPWAAELGLVLLQFSQDVVW